MKYFWLIKMIKSIKCREALLIFTLVVASVAFCYPCYMDVFNVTDDMPFHLSRIRSIALNLRLQNFLPTIYGDSLNDYGYGCAFFYPDLWLYIPAVFVSLGLPILRSYQFFVILITIATALTMYCCTHAMLNTLNTPNHDASAVSTKTFLTVERKTSVLATILYLGFPYRLTDVYLRGALGEILTFVFLPGVALGLVSVIYRQNYGWKILSVSMIGILYSHVISVLIVSISIFFVVLMLWRKFQLIWRDLLKTAVFCAFAGSAFLLPLIEQMNDNTYYFNVKRPFGRLAGQAIQLITDVSPFTLTLFNIVLLFALFCLIQLWKTYKFDNQVVFLAAATTYLVIMTTNLFPWDFAERLPLIKYVQFPWRLSILVTYLCSLLIAKIATACLKTRSLSYFSFLEFVFLIGVFSVSFITQPYARYARTMSYIPDSMCVGRGEYLPATSDLDEIAKAKYLIPEVIAGSLIPCSYFKAGNSAIFSFYQISSESVIILPVIYYKGYAAWSNGELMELSRSDKGLLEVKTQGAKYHMLRLTYINTTTQLMGLAITFFAVIFFIYGEICKNHHLSS